MARGLRHRGVTSVRSSSSADGEIFPPERWNAVQDHFNLTPRQVDVCRYVCRAYENKQIAIALEITQDTVRVHLKDIFRKVQVRNRVELAVQLVRALQER
jgi:DNA-binding NarL/FixJ family response regulator